MYQGYLALGATEIANAARTAAYVRTQMPTIPLKNKYEIDSLHVALEDEPYTSPVIDGADWLDVAAPASRDFFGLYPLSIEGVEDSTLTTPVIEGVKDGASHGFSRHASRTIRVRGMLIARSDAGLSYGHAWLNAALEQADCGSHQGSCGAGSLSYFSAYPQVSTCCYRLLELAGASVPFGDVTRRNEVVHHETRRELECQPIRASWAASHEGSLRDMWAPGTMVRAGYLERDTFRYVNLLGPVLVRRDNVMFNPAFRDSLSLWTYSGGVSRLTEDGPDGLPFAQVSDGSFLESAVMTAGAGPAVLSFSYCLPAGEELTVTFTAKDGSVSVSTVQGNIDGEWVRAYVDAPTGVGVKVRFSGSATFGISAFLFEAGTERGDFFDLVQLPAPSSGYGYEVVSVARSEWPIASALWEGLTEPDRDVHPLRYNLDFSPRALTFEVLQGEVKGLTLHQSIYVQVPMDEQLRPYSRFMHNVDAVTGATTIRDYAPSAGAMREVEFYLNAGMPHQFSLSRLGAYLRERETGVVDVECPQSVLNPLVDPDLPSVVFPPRPPVVPTLGVDEVPSWERFWLAPPVLASDSHNEETNTINYSAEIPTWLTAVPTLQISTRDLPVRQVRVRFYPNPFGRKIESDTTGQPVDLCSYCAEYIVGYIPANTVFTVDGVSQHAWASMSQVGSVSADHVMYGTDGVPMQWPELSCGTDYLVSVDVPSTDAAAFPDHYMHQMIDLRYTDRM